MPRPEKLRRVGFGAEIQGFKPMGRPARDLEVEPLRIDELEALRLADLEGLYQETAAARMGVSRATFARILARARRAVATALIEEKILIVSDGPVVATSDTPFPCPVHGDGTRRGRGCRCRGRNGRNHRGPDDR
jgi:predicted DNA-binding protein (UPF0251 family)